MANLSRFRRRSRQLDRQDVSLDVFSGGKGNYALYGLNDHDNTPICFDRGDSIHTALIGPTGCGKSSTTAMLIEQGILQGRSFLVFDLKGLDHMFLGTMTEAAERCGIDRPIHLTTTFGKSTHLVPFMRSESWMYGLSPEAKADALVAALSVSDPQSHSWWSDAVEALYLFILENSDPTEIDDFVKFSAMIERRRGDLPKSLRDASLHGLLKMQRLARVTMFSPPSDCNPEALEHAFHFASLFKGDKQILVYVSVDSLRTPKIAESVTGLLCRQVLNVGAQLGTERERGVEVVIDETQRAICGNSFLDEMLTLSRSAGISFTAAFQDLESLKHRGVDYASKFEENCHVHLTFGAHSPDAIKRQVQVSGETIEIMKSNTYTHSCFPGQRRWTESFHEQKTSRLGPNDIAAISADKERFIFRATKNTDLCALEGLPVVARAIRHITEEQYKLRCKTPWPKLDSRTVLCGPSGNPQESLPTNTPVPATGIPMTTDKPKVIRPSRRR